MSEIEKKAVDESWKNQVEKEKGDAQTKEETFYEPSFMVFISSLSMQAMIAMGKLESPIDGKMEVNLPHARYLIDTIGVLKEKTQGNLSPEEARFIEESLYNLRMVYLDTQKIIK